MADGIKLICGFQDSRVIIELLLLAISMSSTETSVALPMDKVSSSPENMLASPVIDRDDVSQDAYSDMEPVPGLMSMLSIAAGRPNVVRCRGMP